MTTPIPRAILDAFDDDEEHCAMVAEAIALSRVQGGRCVHIGCTNRATRTGVTCGRPLCMAYLTLLPADLYMTLTEEKAACAPPSWVGTLLAGAWGLLGASAALLAFAVGQRVGQA